MQHLIDNKVLGTDSIISKAAHSWHEVNFPPHKSQRSGSPGVSSSNVVQLPERLTKHALLLLPYQTCSVWLDFC